MLIKIYMATVAVALVCFVLEYLRCMEFLEERNMKCVVTIHALLCIVYCFVPVFNIYMGHTYYYLACVAEDEEIEEILLGDTDE